jgi:beta propeller repeat protein
MRTTHLCWQLLVLSAAVAILASTSAPADASRFTDAVNLTGDSEASSPAISGTKVVYSTHGSYGHTSLVCYDLATSNAISLASSDNGGGWTPAIDGNRVVYEDYRNGNSDIYLYDLATSTEKRLTTNAAVQSSPDISGTNVVYTDRRNGTYDIYLYSLATSTERRLTTSPRNQTRPAISGTKVVYTDDRNEYGGDDVYLYDLATSTEKRLTRNRADQFDPDISGTDVVYTDSRNGNYDIYLFSLAKWTERRLTANGANQHDPAISRTNVVYGDERSGFDEGVYFYDLATSAETPLWEIGSQRAYRAEPAISGNRVVYMYWDLQYMAEDVYFRRILPNTISTSIPSVIAYGEKATWSATMLDASSAGITGQALSIQYSSDGSFWRKGATTLTTTGGAFSLVTPSLTTARWIRVRFYGSSDYLPALSSKVLVWPRVYLTTPVAPATVNRGTYFTTSGYLKPHHASGTSPVKLQFFRAELQAEGTYVWTLRKTVSALASDYSTYSRYRALTSLPYAGKWMVRAWHPGDALNAKTFSPTYDHITVE